MTLERLRVLLDAYGARAERWPDAERDTALALLERSADARALRADAGRLDELLDLAPVTHPTPELVRRVMAGAPPNIRQRPSVRRPRLMVAVGALAAAAALIFWMVPKRSTVRNVTARYATVYQGSYSMPTDVLLVPPGWDLSRTAPSVGCVSGGLACGIQDVPREKESRLRSNQRGLG
jgi:hypothetical protein